MSVYADMKQAIITGVYPSGHRLTEEALTKDWGVSRTPVREALQQLAFDGLVTPLKRGYMVRTFTKEDLRQVYDLRALLESYAAGQAASYRTEENLIKMSEANCQYEKALHSQEEEVQTLQKIVKVNRIFHDTVIHASKNEHVRDLIDKVVVLPLVYRSFYWFNQVDQLQSYQSHVTIMNAIKARDTDRAKAAMYEHIYRGRDYVLDHYEGGTSHD
ncbi:GntR family transcriptional regulator [Alteribacillus sp. HJP-4]|uniref:GntR family transcriptional regulator n=1 Tax=Alteribacillus sp. HJP-4 TaxID=2775394 RepID=UPI0035CCDE13